MSAEQKQLLEFATQDLVAQIVAKEGVSTSVATDRLHSSPVFDKVNDVATGLYRESPEYLYQFYKASCA